MHFWSTWWHSRRQFYQLFIQKQQKKFDFLIQSIARTVHFWSTFDQLDDIQGSCQNRIQRICVISSGVLGQCMQNEITHGWTKVQESRHYCYCLFTWRVFSHESKHHLLPPTISFHVSFKIPYLEIKTKTIFYVIIELKFLLEATLRLSIAALHMGMPTCCDQRS